MLAAPAQLLTCSDSLESLDTGNPNGSETQISHLNTTASAGGRP